MPRRTTLGEKRSEGSDVALSRRGLLAALMSLIGGVICWEELQSDSRPVIGATDMTGGKSRILASSINFSSGGRSKTSRSRISNRLSR